MNEWRPKKKYNNEYNDFEVIIYYIKPGSDYIHFKEGTINGINETNIAINVELININVPIHYKYIGIHTFSHNIIKKIFVKDKKNFKKIKEVLYEKIYNLPTNILDIILDMNGMYVEI